MDGLSPIEALLTGRLRDDEFLSAVDRVIADGTESDRTMLVQDWRTKSGRIRRPETRRQLDEKVRRLAWATGDTSLPKSGHPAHGAAVPLRVGDTLANRFVIEAVIGSGGMGTVFRALDLRRQEALDRNPHVAIKTLSAEVLRRDDSVQMLQREARKAQSLSHLNIVRVYDFDRDGVTLFLTMELLVGTSLETTVRNNGPAGAPLDKMLPVIEQIVSALQFAHDEGIVHSDLKPGNIIILPSGRVKVIDFGIARAIPNPDEQTADRTLFDINALGAMTPAYASPEMIEGSDPDPRDDVFALACIVFECLTGRHPFGRTPASVARAGTFIPSQPPGLHAVQWKAILRGLHFERSQRTPTPAQFLSELTAQGEPSWLRNKRLVYAGILGTLVIGTAVGASLYFYNIEKTTQQRPGPAADAVHSSRQSAGEANVTTLGDAGAQQAQQKTAEDVAAQQVQQKAAEEAAARQAQQKAAEEAAAQKAQQDAIRIGPPQIAEAQRSLTSMGLDTGATDGKAGPRTREMVRAFQSAVGEPPTGEITPALLALLQRPAPSPAARAKSLFTLAAEARRGVRLADAARLYESALKLAPNDADGLLSLGDLRSDQRDYDAARRAYEAVHRGGGPKADVARQRLAALPAPQPIPDVASKAGVPTAGTDPAPHVAGPASDASNGDHVALGAGNMRPDAVAARPQPRGQSPNPFDGVYEGMLQLAGLNLSDCPPNEHVRVAVEGGRITFQSGRMSHPVVSLVAADGSFGGYSSRYQANTHLVAVSLTGKIINDSIEGDTSDISCKYRFSLKKTP